MCVASFLLNKKRTNKTHSFVLIFLITCCIRLEEALFSIQAFFGGHLVPIILVQGRAEASGCGHAPVKPHDATSNEPNKQQKAKT